MNFLAPLFLVGAAAIAGPIIFHLIRRTTRERTVFSSLMFLAPSPPRLSKRHRLEHLLLLLLRCAAIALLALGFARPFLRQPPPIDPAAAQPKRIVILVDTSASMRRDGVWPAAREKVDAVLRRAGPADHVALFTFDRVVNALVPFEEWNRTGADERVAMANARLAVVSPSWGGTHLGSALIAAAEALAEPESGRGNDRASAATGPRQIVLVSDLQAGSRLDTLQAYEWPKGVQLFIEPVKARNPTNAGVQILNETAAANDANHIAENAVRVRVTNSPESKREQFQVGWARPVAPAGAAAANAGVPLDVYVPPGQSRVVTVPSPQGGVDADRIVLRGDDEAFDNIAFTIPPLQQHVTALWLGGEAPDDPKQPLFFLRRALSDTPRVAVKVVAHAPGSLLNPAEVAGASVLFVADPLGAGDAAAVHEAMVGGKVVVAVAKSAALGPTLGALLGATSVSLAEVQPSNYAMFGEIDFQHPLFAPFGDPRFSDFTKIHVWKYRRLDAAAVPNARIIAKWDSGDPAILEAPVGAGRLIVFTTGWQPDDSQLAVSSKFVPLAWSLLEAGADLGMATSQYVIGDKLTPPAGAAWSLRLPNDTRVNVTAAGGGFVLSEPGIYELTESPAGKPRRVAVNLDPSESRTAALDLDELEHLGVPVVAQSQSEAVVREESRKLLAGADAENRQKLWRWFVAATLAILLLESALAGWTARRATLGTEEATP